MLFSKRNLAMALLATTILSSQVYAAPGEEMQSFSTSAKFSGNTPEERASVSGQATKVVADGGYMISFDEATEARFVQVMSNHDSTVFFGSNDDAYQVQEIVAPTSQYATVINVVNADTIDQALALQALGMKPLVMDCANPKNPGGSPSSASQEEQMAMRSDLRTRLVHAHAEAQKYNLIGAAGNFVPFEGGILLSNVNVFRTNGSDGYRFMESVSYIDVMAVSALKHEDRKKDGKDADSDYYPQLADKTEYSRVMAQKLRAMFDAAILNGNDSLVLAAIGCGAFCNPAEEVVAVYETILAEYANVFKRIDFAVFAVGKVGRANYEVFKNAFDGKVQALPAQ